MNFYKNPHNPTNQTGETDIKSEDSKLSVLFSNPITAQKAMPQNNRTSANRLYGGYSSNLNTKNLNINYKQTLKIINEVLMQKSDIGQLFYMLHNVLSANMQANFSAIGLLNAQSNCVNVKLIDKIGSIYNTKIMLNDDTNPLIKSYLTKTIQTCQDNKFLRANYLSSSPCIILPLVSFGECLGVFIVGDNHLNSCTELYQFLANYIAIFAHNRNLAELVDKNTDIDSLTGLANHKCFQEELIRQIESCNKSNSPLSVCIFDVLNISQINREFGHAKGDEIIKTVAKKIKQNIRNTDFAGRYGGDEISIIMPNTSTDEAKYIAEYLSYALSCVLIDDVGPVKLSCGIATYPQTSKNHEKLVLLAEQAMYISKSKCYESGECVIVTSEDYNFWDDEALKCFAEVLTKNSTTNKFYQASTCLKL